jgi:hypothetical protein
MPAMTNQHLARIEAQLERLIEGAFTQLFRQRVNAHDVLLHITRAFEEQSSPPASDDPRRRAPDRYTIHLHPDMQARLLQHEPDILALLAEHISELATSLDYHLLRIPVISMVADDTLAISDVVVIAEHQTRPQTETASLARVDVKPAERNINAPQLIINGEFTVELTNDIINLGRSRENDIQLDDAYVSRHHAQLRLRFGSYTLFDNDSQHGTFVNDVRIHEHRLQPGDMIRMGKCRIIYVEDTDAAAHSQTAIQPISGL